MVKCSSRTQTNQDGFIYTSAIKIHVFMKSSTLNLIEMSITCKICFSTTDPVAWDILWPQGYKTFFLCSTQLNMKFFLLINVKMPTLVGILTFVNRKNSILGLSESEKKTEFLDIFYTYEHLKFHAQLS